MPRLRDEIELATGRLARAGVESPRADAELLAAAIHGVSRAALHTVPDDRFDPRFWDAVGRREAREPLQHITGRAFFRYLELEVGPGVFVPRPETEVMTGWAIEALRSLDAAEPVVADLGTGSGAIALAIATEVRQAQVHAVEADPLALRWAERNLDRAAAAMPGLRDRVSLVAADFGALREPGLDGATDLVISNPPYIPAGAWVPPEVGEHDPATALWGGPDGLNAIRRIERVAARLLRPGGLVAVEHGDQQQAAVLRIFTGGSAWRMVGGHRDLAGRDRFVTAVRRWSAWRGQD
jgi:release factor glutamine methyltransferase